MSCELYSGFYPRKCIDSDILPFLNTTGNDKPVSFGFSEFSGMDGFDARWLPWGFFDECKKLAIYDEVNDCYIFDDKEKLFKFAKEFSKSDGLTDQANYIIKGYSEKAPIYIIWCR